MCVTDSFLVVLIVLVALILLILGTLLTILVKFVLPRVMQAKAMLEHTNRLLADAEEQKLIQKASSAIEDGRSAIGELKQRIESLGPVLEKVPALVEETFSAVSEARAIMRRVDSELPAEMVAELLDGVKATLEKAQTAVSNLDDLLAKARQTRDSVTDGITFTRDKVDDALGFVGALKAGVEAGIKSLRK